MATPPVGMAYGAAYIDRNEGWPICKEQIDSFLNQNVNSLAFDIIGRADQIKQGNMLKLAILDYAPKVLGLPLDNIFIVYSIAKNPEHDPRQDKEMRTAQQALIEGFKQQKNAEIISRVEIPGADELAVTKEIVKGKAPENNLELIKNTLRTNYNSPVSTYPDAGARDNIFGLMNNPEPQEFLLDVKDAQTYFDTLYDKPNKVSPIFSEAITDLELPFNKCLFAFKEGLTVQVAKDVKLKWIGFALQDMGIHKKINHIYKGMIIGLDTETNSLIIQNLAVLVSPPFNQPPPEGGLGTDVLPYGSLVTYIKHHCVDPKLCAIDELGGIKDWALNLTASKQHFCQGILDLDSFFETITYIVNKVHGTGREVVKKTPDRTDAFTPGRIPRELLLVKKEMPKQGYFIPLEGTKYKYDPKDIAVGTGTPHKYRYDVRRHPRIVGGKLIWVKEHTKGSGSYIKGVRGNTRSWFVTYFWYQAEKLTKYRIFELLAIKMIHFLKRSRII